MDYATIIAIAARVIGALGAQRLGLEQAEKIVSYLLRRVADGQASVEDLQELEETVREMTAAGRDPTEEEWSALETRLQSALDRIERA